VRFTVAFTLALAACGSSSTPISNRAPDETPRTPDELPPPDRAQLAAMSWDDRCAAVAPRAKPCLDELMIAQSAGIDPALGDAMKENLATKPAASARELEVMHRTQCASDDAYPAAAVKCWSRTDCKQFATCVAAELDKPKPKP
jgi:hypothetical protein